MPAGRCSERTVASHCISTRVCQNPARGSATTCRKRPSSDSSTDYRSHADPLLPAEQDAADSGIGYYNPTNFSRGERRRAPTPIRAGKKIAQAITLAACPKPAPIFSGNLYSSANFITS